MKIKPPKVLFWDIETSPLLMASFTRYDLKVPYSMVLQDWFVICAAWKWQGKKTIHGAKITDDKKRFKKDYTDDKYVIIQLSKIIEEADIIVAHNGDHFDWKKFTARLVFHNLPMVRRPIMIDTLKLSKEHLFTSNKLDDLGTHLKLGNKLPTALGLWKRAVMGDKKAIRAMFKYNKGDIPPLEALYKRLKPYTKTGLPNLNLWCKDESCPRCMSTHYHKKGLYRTTTQIYQEYQCQDCLHYFKGKKAVVRKDRR